MSATDLPSLTVPPATVLECPARPQPQAPVPCAANRGCTAPALLAIMKLANGIRFAPAMNLGDLNSCFGQSDVGAVAKQQQISVPIADPEADGAAHYRPQH